MGKERMQIKKMDNITARKVTFSKRRRGILKKAEELSILCDADVAIIILSSSGRKLVQYSSSSMNEILQRHSSHAKNLGTIERPSVELQPAENEHSILSREVAEKSGLLRGMKGEDLQGMKMEELQQLEKSLQVGLKRLKKKKGEKIMAEIKSLQQKGMQLMEENNQLRRHLMEISGGEKLISAESQTIIHEDSPSSASATTSPCSPHDYESLDTSLSLRLGLNYRGE